MTSMKHSHTNKLLQKLGKANFKEHKQARFQLRQAWCKNLLECRTPSTAQSKFWHFCTTARHLIVASQAEFVFAGDEGRRGAKTKFGVGGVSRSKVGKLQAK